jgi:predicted transposase YbfD/YdcC
MIALCCVLCGGQGPTDMALFARAKEGFLRGFLVLENGLPSHDSFRRLFLDLDPDQFRDSFQRFMAQFCSRLQGVVAVDGKVVRVRETAEKTTTETAYYLLSKPLAPERLNEVARQHWRVENSLHWRLDVVHRARHFFTPVAEYKLSQKKQTEIVMRGHS